MSACEYIFFIGMTLCSSGRMQVTLLYAYNHDVEEKLKQDVFLHSVYVCNSSLIFLVMGSFGVISSQFVVSRALILWRHFSPKIQQ